MYKCKRFSEIVYVRYTTPEGECQSRNHTSFAYLVE